MSSIAHWNVEIKARCGNPELVRKILKEKGADFRGKDFQKDIYFRSPHGRLKLREGTIENCLVYYERPDQAGPKEAKVVLYPTAPDSPLKEILKRSLGVLVTVEKEREIYFLENVKIHLDFVPGLGKFLEVEAIDRDGTVGKDRLHGQCRDYLELFGVREEELIRESYSDMLLLGQPEQSHGI